jgi:hypothetical protein
LARHLIRSPAFSDLPRPEAATLAASFFSDQPVLSKADMTRFLATAHRAFLFWAPHNDQLRACRRLQVLHLIHRIVDASRFQSNSSKFHHQLKEQAISISPSEYSHLGKYIAAMEINGKHFMAINEPIPLDLKTVSTLKEVLDDGWYSLSAEQQATMSKTKLNSFLDQQPEANVTASACLPPRWILPQSSTLSRKRHCRRSYEYEAHANTTRMSCPIFIGFAPNYRRPAQRQ